MARARSGNQDSRSDTLAIMRGFKSLGLDEDAIKRFRSLVKQELVVPEQLIAEVSERVDYRGRVVLPLDEEDAEWLRATIGRHRTETGSAVAERILASWHREATRFAKVMPKDYKRVLEAAREAEERGVPVEEAIMAAAHG